MSQEQVKTFIDGVGHTSLVRVGLTPRNIRNARSTGQFAAKWYFLLKALGEEAGVPVPPGMFTFKTPDKKHGDKNNPFKATG